MGKYFSMLLFICLSIGCKQSADKKESKENSEKTNPILFYSDSVKDTLFVFINLPSDYDAKQKNKYPVVCLLDANLYFDIDAAIVNKYSEVGLLPPVILVGIGYKDFETMDSLRSRDLTFPVAIPEYEMSISGGADKFSAFLQKELLPYIDSNYTTDAQQRVLMGHSLGGYFVDYSLYRDLLNNNNYFSGYIAASPSIHYNNYYLLRKFDELPAQKNMESKIKAYISFGGLEDAEDEDDEEDSTMMKTDEVMASLNKSIAEKQSGRVIYKGDVYSNLGHMDTPLPGFIKGLQWVLTKEK